MPDPQQKNIKVIECYQETLGFASELKKKRKDFRQQISLIKFLFDLPLLEHHNIRLFPCGVNALNGESIIQSLFLFPSSFVVRTE